MSQPKARRRRIGHLECIEVAGDPSAPTVVLFHGYGADMSDLASLAGSIQAPKGTNWIFPNGHITVPLGGHYEGRAWFPLAMAELERAMAAGEHVDFSQVVPPGMKRARELGLELVEKLEVPPEKLVLGGFSQGAMLATELVLNMEKPPAGLAILSGTLVNAESWRQRAAGLQGFRFFQSHGQRDSVLGFPLAKKLETLFREAGWQGQMLGFGGAHEIPPEVIIQLGAYLRKVLG